MAQSVVFRADASRTIGLGHVMRCLTLANVLRERGAACRFIMRAHEGNAADIVRRQGHGVSMLPVSDAVSPADAAGDLPLHAAWLGESWQMDAQQSLAALEGQRSDWLVTDHYGIDYRWHKALRPHAGKIMVIDDLADRVHDCDLLLDQTYGRQAADYGKLTPQGCKVLAGSHYALLRPEFAEMRAHSLERRRSAPIGRILVAMGGTDPENVTSLALESLNTVPMPADIAIDVVLGKGAPHIEGVRHLASEMPLNVIVHVDIADMAGLMAEADLAIGAAGATTWERCCLGVPSIMMILAQNQSMIARQLADAGAAISVPLNEGSKASLAQAIGNLVQSARLRSALSTVSAALVDGNGASRVADCLAEGLARS